VKIGSAVLRNPANIQTN